MPALAQPSLPPQQQPIQRPLAAPPAAAAAVSPEELAQRVMLQSSRDAHNDLRDLLASMDAERRRRDAIRQATASMRSRQPAPPTSAVTTVRLPPNPCLGGTNTLWRACLDRVTTKLAGVRGSPRDPALDAQLQGLHDAMDAQHEMSEAEVLAQIQAYQSRVDTLMRMLSDMERRISETQSNVTQNLK